MEIKLYTFSKRTNSTKRPTDGTSFLVRLKERTDIYNPTFLLAENITQVKAYNYATYDNLYYYVENAVSAGNNLTEITCRLDAAATLKTEIGNAHGFCVYGTNGNYLKPDGRISLTDEITYTHSNTAISFVNSASYSPYFFVNISGESGTRVYLMPPSRLSGFFSKLDAVNSSEAQQISTAYGSVYDAINTITAVPFAPGADDGTEQITLAQWTTAGTGDPYRYIDPTGNNANQNIISASVHLSITEDYPFLATAPYSHYKLFLPWYGNVELNNDYVTLNSTGAMVSAYCSASLDIPTATLTWKVSPDSTSWANKDCGETYTAQIGRGIGVAQHSPTDKLNNFLALKGRIQIAGQAVSGLLGTAAGAKSLGGLYTGMASTLIGTATSAITHEMDVKTYNWGGNVHTVTTGGENGGGIFLNGANSNYLVLTRMHHNIDGNNLDKTYIGAPVGKMGKVSDFGGFVMMNGASVSASFPDQYIQEANGLIASGIYYE